ncbi:glycosyltransferase [Winogradskyella sp. A3E31]|uniref:glycosyltransferase n=1 Tax=Winogradskyella sp. A3E31 TaxID=3349637 RepID=UPI00398AAC03
MKRILVAPLHWGLGHATRCIPIINALMQHQFEVVLASDGAALSLLRKEFPKLEAFELPSYNISYSKKGTQFKSKLIRSAPHILKTIKKEKKVISDYLEKNRLDGIISDNRFGIRHSSIPSVFITHQLKVLSGSTTWLSTKLNQKMISKFDECWVPDHPNEPSLSGILGHSKNVDIPIKYVGPLSRFQKKASKSKYKLMVVLSGPEPQRSMLENILTKQLMDYKDKIVFIKGVVDDKQDIKTLENITFYNYMTSDELEYTMNASELILSRSGYTTVMDLDKLQKKAFFIPTPGQFEQEYLAKRLSEQKIAPFCKQDEFTLKKLKEIGSYTGFKASNTEINYRKLFSLF